MRQVVHNLKTGSTELIEVPIPSVKSGQVQIATTYSLISVGTERMLINFSKANWIKKARLYPDKVEMVLNKIKSDGIQPTLESVFNKLDRPLLLGYCNVGRITELGRGVVGFNIGDRIISNGKHAEVVTVPFHLCAKIPDKISDEEASFTVLGSIALQGIRLSKPTLGETVVVIGLGVIGLITVQLLRANGCRVLALDFDQERLRLAQQFGAEVVDLAAGQDPIKIADTYSRGRGVDAAIVTAATPSSDPIRQAALMCRKRGRIVLVGVTGLNLSRDDFYKKELTLQVSASYGPGRYDPNYEDKGQDYPVGFVRWTAQRNFEAVLDMMACGQLDVTPLISHRFDIKEAEQAYRLVQENKNSLGIILQYPRNEISRMSSTILLTRNNCLRTDESEIEHKQFSFSFLGAGNYATAKLIPSFLKAGAQMRCVASSTGASGLYVAKKFGFEETTTDTNQIFTDTNTHAVIIATRHDSHCSFVLQALKAGKHVFVEKPLCITFDELSEIETTYSRILSESINPPILMVGYNRRFAPHIQKIKQTLNTVTGPKSFILTVNAGFVPKDHWTQDIYCGGGRIIGEVCHFIDLLRFLANSPIESWNKSTMTEDNNDTVTINLKFRDGSIGAIHYFSNGSKIFPKERLEIFSSGRILQLDNYRKLKGFGWTRLKNMNLWRQDKGQIPCARSFVDAIATRSEAPIPINEIFETSRVAIEIAQ